jgi:hypothetical protein
VRANGRHLGVKPGNLRPCGEEPFRFAVGACGGCHAAGIVSSSPDLATVTRHCSMVLHACSHCREAVYCSRECQKKDWRRYKPRYTVVKDAHDLLRAYAIDPALNEMLCERADEEEDMPKRRLIHLECPSARTLRELCDKDKLLAPGGVDVDVQYCPVVAQLDRADESEGMAALEAAMDQTWAYDVEHEISLVVSAPAPGGHYVVVPALVPRLLQADGDRGGCAYWENELCAGLASCPAGPTHFHPPCRTCGSGGPPQRWAPSRTTH